MKRITTILMLLITLIFSCEKERIERIAAPIGDGVAVDSIAFLEIDSAKNVLICKIRKCELAQNKTATDAQRKRERELIDAGTCHDVINE